MASIAAISTRYAGRKYRSRTEARWACFFDACAIPFQYEFEGFRLPSGPYLPDFWLPTFQMYFEIKGSEPSDIERRKCVELAKASGCVVLLAIGQPEERFQILWFDGDSDDVALYAIARDRRADAGYWLVANNDKATGGPLRDPWAAFEGVTFNPTLQPVEAAPAKPLGLWRRFWGFIVGAGR